MSLEKKRAPFIVFEGIDGSGKSTQAKLLAESLKELGQKIHLTYEPTKYRIGSMLREILTGKQQADELTIAALFVADRLDHVQNPEYGMMPKLSLGETVICDRYYYSSYAYHSQFINMDWVIEANSLAADLLRPDVVFFLDLSPEESIRRIKANRNTIDHYEKIETLDAVYGNYLKAIQKEGKKDNVIRINANRNPDIIAAEIWAKTEQLKLSHNSKG